MEFPSWSTAVISGNDAFIFSGLACTVLALIIPAENAESILQFISRDSHVKDGAQVSFFIEWLPYSLDVGN